MNDPEKLAAAWRILADARTIEEILAGLRPMLLLGEPPPGIMRRPGAPIRTISSYDCCDHLATHNVRRVNGAPVQYSGVS
ncbi:hypothetical protein OG394_29095 [Kribbella sp. NBC_01245]|uniref:hypothetical protein n=1 Tax=Kribbella sp. NBC_01245 TaxID=2903578 RepID=UPI002E2B3CC1|nr:hypothetical protein [Kribbella sp. NBC_01245]